VIVNWCREHVNGTLAIGYFGLGGLIGVLSWTLPFLPFNALFIVLLLGLGFWVLRRKGRSLHHLWWILVGLFGVSQVGFDEFVVGDARIFVGYLLGVWVLPMLIWLFLREKATQ